MAPSFDDRMLEVVAVLGASQMGMSKVFGGMQHHRISQVRHFGWKREGKGI